MRQTERQREPKIQQKPPFLFPVLQQEHFFYQRHDKENEKSRRQPGARTKKQEARQSKASPRAASRARKKGAALSFPLALSRSPLFVAASHLRRLEFVQQRCQLLDCRLRAACDGDRIDAVGVGHGAQGRGDRVCCAGTTATGNDAGRKGSAAC